MFDLDAALLSLDAGTIRAILLDCEVVPPEETSLDDLRTMLTMLVPPTALQPVLQQWLAPKSTIDNFCN